MSRKDENVGRHSDREKRRKKEKTGKILTWKRKIVTI